MEHGTRVELLVDYTDAQGFSFEAGQCGSFIAMEGNLAGVHFDGYEAARTANELRRKEFGEGANEVPWLGLIPIDKLRIKAVPPHETPC